MVTLSALFAALAAGCASTSREGGSAEGADGNKLTVGVVQKEIRKGMTGAEVAEVLGSPNIVSTDEEGREVWIYDKITTERVSTGKSSYGTLILIGYQKEASSSSTSQRTLTVIIKFDQDHKVRDFAYHSSRF